MAPSNRDIPAHIKQQLRQEAGFGCCACGNPVYEYHHIIPFADVMAHQSADMMTLCPNHHREVTAGAVSEIEQREWKASPQNISKGFVDGLLKIPDRTVAVRLGSVDMVGPGFKLAVDDRPLLSIAKDQAGRLNVSLDLYDQDDQLLLCVRENEWISGDPLPWDFEFGHRWLRLRRRQRAVAVEIDARSSPVSVSGRFWRANQCFAIDREGVSFNGIVQGVGIRELGVVGCVLCADTAGRQFQIKPDPALGEGALVTWPDRTVRLRKCEEALDRILAKRGTQHEA